MRHRLFLGLFVLGFACSKSGLAVKQPGADASEQDKRDVAPMLDLAGSDDLAAPNLPDGEARSDVAVFEALGDRVMNSSAGDASHTDGDVKVIGPDAAIVDGMSSSLVAGEIACGGITCNDSSGPCCPAARSMSRAPLCAKNCITPAVGCDGPEDCTTGRICCSIESATSGFASASCAGPDACSAPSRRICHVDADCPSGQHCDKANPLPITPASHSVDGMREEWEVEYLVCTP